MSVTDAPSMKLSCQQHRRRISEKYADSRGRIQQWLLIFMEIFSFEHHHHHHRHIVPGLVWAGDSAKFTGNNNKFHRRNWFSTEVQCFYGVPFSHPILGSSIYWSLSFDTGRHGSPCGHLFFLVSHTFDTCFCALVQTPCEFMTGNSMKRSRRKRNAHIKCRLSNVLARGAIACDMCAWVRLALARCLLNAINQ